MATMTRICNIENLIPPLSRMLAPVLSSGERILICVENTYAMGQESAYAAYTLTQNSLYYAFQDVPPAGGMKEMITLREISAIERRTMQSGNPQLVFYGQNGRKFTSCEFSSQALIDTFVKSLRDVGLSVKPV
jgi:hypothetical protein